MFLKLMILSVILIAVAGIVLGIKYYKSKRPPTCVKGNNNVYGQETDVCPESGDHHKKDCT